MDSEQEVEKKLHKHHHKQHNLIQTEEKGKHAGDYGADDIFGEQEAEDKAIMKSIEYAENKL